MGEANVQQWSSQTDDGDESGQQVDGLPDGKRLWISAMLAVLQTCCLFIRTRFTFDKKKYRVFFNYINMLISLITSSYNYDHPDGAIQITVFFFILSVFFIFITTLLRDRITGMTFRSPRDRKSQRMHLILWVMYIGYVREREMLRTFLPRIFNYGMGISTMREVFSQCFRVSGPLRRFYLFCSSCSSWQITPGKEVRKRM